MDAGLHSAERQPEALSDLDVGEIADEGEHERFALQLRQLAESADHPLTVEAQLDRLGDGVVTRLEVPQAEFRVAGVSRLRRAHAIDSPRVRASENPPRGRAPTRIESSRLLPDLEKDLLHHLLGLRLISQYRSDASVDPRRELVEQLGERGLVPGRDALEQNVRGCGIRPSEGLFLVSGGQERLRFGGEPGAEH